MREIGSGKHGSIVRMEPQQGESKGILAPLKKVTPSSKYLAVALLVLLPFFGGYIGYQFVPAKIIEKVERIEVPKYIPVEIPGTDNQKELIAPTDLPTTYAASGYRVVSVVQNPFYSEESKYDTLVVATPRGVNDYTCGGRYVPSHCYLFLESSYADIPTPKFVGTWSNDAISGDITFVTPTVIEITTGNGDAGYSHIAKWLLDLETGSTTKTFFEGREHF